MKLELRWARAARGELDAIDRHYAGVDPDIADRIGDALLAAAIFLTEWPDAGPQVANTSTRKWRVPNTPFILLYRAEENVLRILHVVHGARDWRKFL